MNLRLSRRLSLVGLALAVTCGSTGSMARSAAPVSSPESRPDIAVHDTSNIVESRSSNQDLTRLHRAVADSFNLYGGIRSDGSNDRRPEGQFSTLELAPQWQGWTGVDLTENPTFWHVDEFNAANLDAIANNSAMWSGVGAGAQGFTTAPGYGNNWNDILLWRGTTNPALFTQVRLDFDFNHDTEPGYDYFYVEYDSSGTWLPWMQLDGTNKDSTGTFTTPASFDQTILFTPLMYSGDSNAEVNLRLRVQSDGAWSDEDGLWPTRGAVQVDNVRTYFNGALKPIVPGGDGVATFEWIGAEPAQERDSEGWSAVSSSFAGNFAKLLPNLEDIDPCRSNLGPQVGFVDDGTIPSNATVGTGGATSGNWSYGVVGGWVVNYTGGVSLGEVPIANEAWSPEIPWNDPNSTEDDALVGGAELRFSVWQHLPLENGIFWVWHIRSLEAGQWSTWRDRNFVYYGGGIGGYVNVQNDVSDLMVSNPEAVQIALGVVDLADVFGFPGNDATPSPSFDNVSFWRYDLGGPAFATRNIDLFQDSFPQSGSMTPGGDPASMAVRMDMARDINTGDLNNVPGDSIVVDVTAAVPGTQLAGNPVMHWLLEANPAFDAVRSLPAGAVDIGPGASGRIRWTGTVIGDSARTQAGAVVRDKFAFDLPNDGPAIAAYQSSEPAMFFPGDRIRYFLEATDTGGGITTLPADTTGYHTGNGFNRVFTVRALPSLVDEGASFSQPDILVINDFGHRGGENEILGGFGQNGMTEDVDFDVYTVRGPSSMVSNGIGSGGAHGASVAQLDGYDKIFYVSGNLTSGLLSDGTNGSGNDKGNDIDLLTQWYDLPGDRHIAFFGDDLAAWLAQSAGAGATFLAIEQGVGFLDTNVRDEIDGQAAPIVRPLTAPFTHDIVAYGGCLSINQFDSIVPLAGAQMSHAFVAPDGTTPYTPAAGVLYERIETIGFDDFRRTALTFPFDLSYVYDPIVNRSPVNITVRTQFMAEILALFGGTTNPGNVTDAPSSSRRFSVEGNRPNPFNPKTEIAFFAPQAGVVSVRIFNLKGELVRELLDGRVEAGRGEVTWDGTDARGAQVSSGVYLYEVRGFGQRVTQKMALVK